MAEVIWDELETQREDGFAEVLDEVPPSLLKWAPGELIWNKSGCVYVCTQNRVLADSNSESGLVHDPKVPLSHLALAFSGLPEFHDLLATDCVFLDSETTGLGITSLPFMVGIGTFEKQRPKEFLVKEKASPNPKPIDTSKNKKSEATPTHFVVRQLFAHHPSQESALLQHLQDLLRSKSVCVTFNGDGFDIPLIRARYELSQYHFPELPLEDPFKDQALLSLDLLPLARKIWRKRIGSCALSNCEARILGFKRTHADVEGAQIPGIYMKYLQSGRADQVSRVFYHNRQDIVSMSYLLRKLAQSAETVASESTVGLTGEEALSMGTTMLRESRWAEAERLLCFATRALSGSGFQASAFRELALYYKRQNRWQDATETWERWLSTTEQESVDPYVELAKFYEWWKKDLPQANMYTRWALHVNSASQNLLKAGQVQKELQHRLNRLERKKLSANQVSD